MLAGNSADMCILPRALACCILVAASWTPNICLFVIELVASHNSSKGAIHPGVAQWLANLLRVSVEEKYSLLYDSAMKVHALLPNRPVKVD